MLSLGEQSRNNGVNGRVHPAILLTASRHVAAGSSCVYRRAGAQDEVRWQTNVDPHHRWYLSGLVTPPEPHMWICRV